MMDFHDYVDTLDANQLRQLRTDLLDEACDYAKFGHNEDWHSVRRDIKMIEGALHMCQCVVSEETPICPKCGTGWQL